MTGLPDDTITVFLGKLAERTAAPAGGATAALNAAQAAALLAMTARFCDDRPPPDRGASADAFASATPGASADSAASADPVASAAPGASTASGERGGRMAEIAAEADRLRDACAALITADGESYGGVLAAYRLRKDTAEQRTIRSAAIAGALVAAAVPPTEVIAAAARLLDLAQTLEPIANRSVAPDVAAAAEALRAAIATSRTNIEANLSGIADHTARGRLTDIIARVDALESQTATIITAIRARYA